MNQTFDPANSPGTIESPQHPLALHTNARSTRLRLDLWGKHNPAPGEFVVWVHPEDVWTWPLDYSAYEEDQTQLDLAEGCRVEVKREGGRTVPERWELWLRGDREREGCPTLGNTVCDLLPDMIRFRTGEDEWAEPVPVIVSIRVPADQPASTETIVIPPIGN